MTYSEAKNFFYSLENLGRKEYLKDPRDAVVYLKRLQVLLDILGNPERRIPHYIHVAGTSGKGSVCLMLDAIWRAAGKKVGTLTSPGIEGLLDRTMVNGKQISKKEFAELTAKLAQALEVYMNR